MAHYLVLIYEDEATWENTDPERAASILGEHTEFLAQHASVVRGGNALEPTATATTIRKDSSGRPVVTDGAFAETKEALGGYYLIEADDLDAALAIAGRVPAPFGGVEVRPIRDLS